MKDKKLKQSTHDKLIEQQALIDELAKALEKYSCGGDCCYTDLSVKIREAEIKQLLDKVKS